MMIPPLIKSYGGRTVLNTPELELSMDRIYALVGANGSGKSTLARLLSRIEESDDRAGLPKVSVGYMPQKSYAFRMSTRANIMLGGEDRDRCGALMEALHIGQLADKRANKLSGGETARMALARLLMKDYELVILDEPTASMDMESTLLAEALLAEYRRQSGCCMLLVTHSLQQARRVADEMILLDKGELAEKSGREEFFQKPGDQRTRRFLDFYGL